MGSSSWAMAAVRSCVGRPARAIEYPVDLVEFAASERDRIKLAHRSVLRGRPQRVGRHPARVPAGFRDPAPRQAATVDLTKGRSGPRCSSQGGTAARWNDAIAGEPARAVRCAAATDGGRGAGEPAHGPPQGMPIDAHDRVRVSRGWRRRSGSCPARCKSSIILSPDLTGLRVGGSVPTRKSIVALRRGIGPRRVLSLDDAGNRGATRFPTTCTSRSEPRRWASPSRHRRATSRRRHDPLSSDDAAPATRGSSRPCQSSMKTNDSCLCS